MIQNRIAARGGSSFDHLEWVNSDNGVSVSGTSTTSLTWQFKSNSLPNAPQEFWILEAYRASFNEFVAGTQQAAGGVFYALAFKMGTRWYGPHLFQSHWVTQPSKIYMGRASNDYTITVSANSITWDLGSDMYFADSSSNQYSPQTHPWHLCIYFPK